MQEIIDQIRAFHRERCFVMEQRKRMQLSLVAYLRMMLGWSKSLPEDQRKAIAASALELVDGVEKDHPQYEVISAALAAREPFDVLEKQATKEMERLAKQLPVWSNWGCNIRGFGARSLAVIVGETGDLSKYETKMALWKRMGLAPGQSGHPPKNATPKQRRDFYEAKGFSPVRRSRSFVIADVLMKQGELYREVYLARKEYERTQAERRGLTVAPTAKIPKGREKEFISDGHIHRRAQRYMEKRFLYDLWRAWRRSTFRSTEGSQEIMTSSNLMAAE